MSGSDADPDSDSDVDISLLLQRLKLNRENQAGDDLESASDSSFGSAVRGHTGRNDSRQTPMGTLRGQYASESHLWPREYLNFVRDVSPDPNASFFTLSRDAQGQAPLVESDWVALESIVAQFDKDPTLRVFNVEDYRDAVQSLGFSRRSSWDGVLMDLGNRLSAASQEYSDNEGRNHESWQSLLVKFRQDYETHQQNVKELESLKSGERTHAKRTTLRLLQTWRERANVEILLLTLLYHAENQLVVTPIFKFWRANVQTTKAYEKQAARHLRISTINRVFQRTRSVCAASNAYAVNRLAESIHKWRAHLNAIRTRDQAALSLRERLLPAGIFNRWRRAALARRLLELKSAGAIFSTWRAKLQRTADANVLASDFRSGHLMKSSLQQWTINTSLCTKFYGSSAHFTGTKLSLLERWRKCALAEKHLAAHQKHAEARIRSDLFSGWRIEADLNGKAARLEWTFTAPKYFNQWQVMHKLASFRSLSQIEFIRSFLYFWRCISREHALRGLFDIQRKLENFRSWRAQAQLLARKNFALERELYRWVYELPKRMLFHRWRMVLEREKSRTDYAFDLFRANALRSSIRTAKSALWRLDQEIMEAEQISDRAIQTTFLRRWQKLCQGKRAHILEDKRKKFDAGRCKTILTRSVCVWRAALDSNAVLVEKAVSTATKLKLNEARHQLERFRSFDLEGQQLDRIRLLVLGLLNLYEQWHKTNDRIKQLDFLLTLWARGRAGKLLRNWRNSSIERKSLDHRALAFVSQGRNTEYRRYFDNWRLRALTRRQTTVSDRSFSDSSSSVGGTPARSTKRSLSTVERWRLSKGRMQQSSDPFTSTPTKPPQLQLFKGGASKNNTS